MSPVTAARLSPAAARLVRRVGFGLRPDQLDTLAGLDVRALAAWLLDAPAPPDPWGTESHHVGPDDAAGSRRRAVVGALGRWVDTIVATDAPFTDWLLWYWHGHFVSAIPEVKDPQLMIEQFRLFRESGRGTFGALAAAVTTDPAMLRYLDGDESTGAAPNENYSRELLELFTVGHGNYTEADIAAGAVALSGWQVPRNATAAVFMAQRHDDTAQTYLGVTGVHDMATTIAAIEAHPMLASAIAGGFGRAIVGPGIDDATIAAAAEAFRSTGGRVDALVGSLLNAVADGADGGPVVTAPFPWLIAALRATGATIDPRLVFAQLHAAGQVPWFAPNVSGWPAGSAWDNAASVVARFTLAVAIAAATPHDAPVVDATDDPDGLGALLGLAGPWSDATRSALLLLDDRRSRLVLALTAPEFVNV